MVATESSMRELGSKIPDFHLADVTDANSWVSNEVFNATPVLVMFICNHCPFVVHIVDQLSKVANAAQQRGVNCVAISSNDVDNYPQDGPQFMRAFAQEHDFAFPYCYDQSQQVALAFGAVCTPDFFIYDAEHKLRYRGQFDDSRPGNDVAVSGIDLSKALDDLVAGRTPSAEQRPSIGCNIKWKAENQPD